MQEYYPPLTGEEVPYTVPAYHKVSRESNQLVMVSKFANGDEQRRLIWERPRKIITVQHKMIKYDYYELLKDFYEDHNGPFLPFIVWFRYSFDGFDWEPEEWPEEYKFRFSETEGFKVEDIKGIWYTVNVKLIETNEHRLDPPN